jgi:hypothetical protein
MQEIREKLKSVYNLRGFPAANHKLHKNTMIMFHNYFFFPYLPKRGQL